MLAIRSALKFVTSYINFDLTTWPIVGRLLSLMLLAALAASANVCTPMNMSFTNVGPFPPIVNGIDSVDWGVARILWTSDATPSVPATQQRINYSTAAEWAANPGVYAHTQSSTYGTVTSSLTVQGGPLSNILPSATYHVQSQSLQGGSWCSAPDNTFTTPARPSAPVPPQLPTKPNLVQPAMTGTHWVYGSNCGGTAGSTTDIVTNNVQDCFLRAQPGDDIGFPPGTYPITQFYIPSPPGTKGLSCSSAASTCTFSNGSSAPANGTQAIFYQPPSPINSGIPYYIINASGSSFQVSYDGVHPLTLLNNGGTVLYTPYPFTLPLISIHSTASANLLPPPGVRLGPDSINQYLPNMPNFQSVDPILPVIEFGDAMGYWFQNIAFSTDPSVAANTNQLDPIGFKAYIQVTVDNRNLAFNQCAFIPAPPPSRSKLIIWGGENIQMTNSMQTGLDWWQPHLSATAPLTFTSNSITIPPMTYSWVGSGGPVGTRRSCPNSGGTVTLMGGTASGNVNLWMNADCSLTAQFPVGITATANTGANINVTTDQTIATTYTYISPLHLQGSGYSVIPFVYLVLSGGNIVASGGEISPGEDFQAFQSGNAFYSGPWGPLYFDNNYHQGAGIAGIFPADDVTDGNTPCGNVNPCQLAANIGDITQTRSTVTTHPCFLYDSPCWNGGNYYWRNVDEVKQAKRVLIDGNIFGPWSAQVGEGECSLHENFSTAFPSFGQPSMTSSSEYTFTNNTCHDMAATGIETSLTYIIPAGYPISNILIQNNLFLNNNGYANVAVNQPFQSDGHVIHDPTSSACPHGHLTQWGNGMNYTFDHNTVWGQGGCFSMIDWMNPMLVSGLSMTNNVLNLVQDPGPYTGYANTGIIYSPLYSTDNCASAQGVTLLSPPCSLLVNWSGNIVLATWTNSNPGSQTEFTTAQINAVKPLLPSSYWPNANTLAGRAAQIGWFNTSAYNFRLASTSPYISGAKASTDNLDVGVNVDQLEQHQGKVSNVRVISKTSTTATIGFYGPDSFACGVDWGTTSFSTGNGTWTRVNGASGSPDPRVQSVSLTGLPAHGLISYRLNCAVMQPTGTIQLP